MMRARHFTQSGRRKVVWDLMSRTAVRPPCYVHISPGINRLPCHQLTAAAALHTSTCYTTHRRRYTYRTTDTTTPFNLFSPFSLSYRPFREILFSYSAARNQIVRALYFFFFFLPRLSSLAEISSRKKLCFHGTPPYVVEQFILFIFSRFTCDGGSRVWRNGRI